MSSPGERTLTYSRNLEDPSLPLWREFAVATVHSAIDSPYAGVKQIVEQSTSWQLPGIHLVDDPKPAEFGTSNWYAQIFGGALGMIVPFTFVSCGVRGVHHLGEKMLHKEVTSLGAKLAATSTTKRLVTPIAHAAASGFVFDFAMRPVSTEEGNFWTARLRNGFCGAATFATLAGVTVGLQELSKLRLAGTPWLVHSTARDAGRHVTAGLVAGSLDAQTRSLLSGHGFAGLEETCQSAVGLAVVGGGLRCHQEVFAKMRGQKSLAQVVSADPELQDVVRTNSDANKLILDHGNTRVRPGDINKVSRLVHGDIDAIDSVFYWDDNRSRIGRYLDDWYYTVRNRVQDGYTETRRLTYSFLNKYNLRHPFQRLGDLVLGAEVVQKNKPGLTAENNPIPHFERELVRFFERIREKDVLFDEATERKKQYEIQDQQSAIRAEFALRLLTLWHGTAEQPGISSHTNAELAALGTPIARVEQIRSLFSANGTDSQYQQPSELTRGMFDLLPSEKPEYRESYDMAREIHRAKARFFNYDERAIERRMAMPGVLHHIDHGYSTATDWVPFEPTAQLPNLFHGTVSLALPSIFTERAMLPALELRLRGIGQTTGECAKEDHPRRAISLTRDFSEAWCYHRHSPLYLNGFPVMIGVSEGAVPRLKIAGISEPGELLVDKLRIGSSWLTKLGLRKMEISHIYVPDGEVSVLQQQLAARRIGGVQVIGFNELTPPVWKSVPGSK